VRFTFYLLYQCLYFLTFEQTGFLSNLLVKVFPSLATRPLHITGESYAGQYIARLLFHGGNSHLLWTCIAVHPQGLLRPGITTCRHCKVCNRRWNIFLWTSLPVWTLCQRWGSWDSRDCILFLCLVQLSVLATYPQIIGYDQDVYDYFKQQLVVDLRLLAFLITPSQNAPMWFWLEPYISTEWPYPGPTNSKDESEETPPITRACGRRVILPEHATFLQSQHQSTLFFYGFEKSFGSLTAPLSPVNRDPWGIWTVEGWFSVGELIR